MAPPPASPAPSAGETPASAPAVAAPWLECEHLSFAWGMQHRGTVVDAEGRVWTYEGGPPVSADRATRSTLEAKVAHGRKEIRELSADELREARALVDAAIASPERRESRMVYDGPTNVCRVYVADGAEGLRAIDLERSDTKEHSVRDGESAARLLAWLKGLSALAPKRDAPP